MKRVLSDLSHLSKAMIRPPAEPPEPPPVAATDAPADAVSPEAAAAAEVLAYFAHPTGGVKGTARVAARPVHAGKSAAPQQETVETLRTRIRTLETELAETRSRAESAAAREATARAECAARNAACGIAERARATLAEECVTLRENCARLDRECARLSDAAENAEPPSDAIEPEPPSDGAPEAAEPPSDAIEPEPPTAADVLRKPDAFPEMFEGELRELVIAALADAQVDAQRAGRDRRAAALAAVLARNPPDGELARRRAALRQVLKDAGCFNNPRDFEKLGFRLISGRNHWKLAYADIRLTLSKTPSDWRANLNSAATMANRCF